MTTHIPRELVDVLGGAIAGAGLAYLAGVALRWWRWRKRVAQELDVIPPQYASSRQLRRQFARGFARRMIEHDKGVRRRRPQ